MALTSAQTVTLLEILGLRGEPGTDAREAFDDAVTAALADPGREDQLVAYVAQWNAISVAPVSTTGAKEYSTTRHRLEVRNKVAVVLGYPVLSLAEYELIVAGTDSANAVQFVSITLGGLYGTDDEYAS